MAEAPDDVVPGEIGVAGADDDLQVGTFVPDVGNGFDAVPAGFHAHVHEGHGVGPVFGQSLEHTFQSLLAGKGGVHLKDWEIGARRRVARRLGAARMGQGPREHAGEEAMDRLVVVDDERSIRRSGAHNGHLGLALQKAFEDGWNPGQAAVQAGHGNGLFPVALPGKQHVPSGRCHPTVLGHFGVIAAVAKFGVTHHQVGDLHRSGGSGVGLGGAGSWWNRATSIKTSGRRCF